MLKGGVFLGVYAQIIELQKGIRNVNNFTMNPHFGHMMLTHTVQEQQLCPCLLSSSSFWQTTTAIEGVLKIINSLETTRTS